MDFLPPFQCVTFAMASSYIISNDTAWYSARRTGTWRDCVFNSHFQIDCVSSVHSALGHHFSSEYIHIYIHIHICGERTPLIAAFCQVRLCVFAQIIWNYIWHSNKSAKQFYYLSQAKRNNLMCILGPISMCSPKILPLMNEYSYLKLSGHKSRLNTHISRSSCLFSMCNGAFAISLNAINISTQFCFHKQDESFAVHAS